MSGPRFAREVWRSARGQVARYRRAPDPLTRVAKVAIVGAGWAGASCARALTDRGVQCEVFERSAVVAGHSRAEFLDGVLYEPNGPHIFHTSNATVHDFVVRFGMRRVFEHRIKTAVDVDPDRELDGALVAATDR